MAKGVTRPYEVPVVLPNGELPEKRIYLVDATSQSAARNFVTAKFVGEAVMANGKRVAALMTSGVKMETAKEDVPPTNPGDA
jgi:hypothetical protein